MWVHVMLTGGCGRAARPSYRTKRGLVKTLWYRTRLFTNTHKSLCASQTEDVRLVRPLLLPLHTQVTQTFSNRHKEANNMRCKMIKYLCVHRYTHIHTSPGGTTPASDADPITYICIRLSSI